MDGVGVCWLTRPRSVESRVHGVQRADGLRPLAVDSRGPTVRPGDLGGTSPVIGPRPRVLSHGVSGPERLGLPTDPALKSQSYASPMSYVGSTRRIVGWAQKTAQRSAAVAVLVWTSAIIFLLAVWVFLLGWYFVVFFLFGIFVIPYRLIRRSQRKNLHVQRTTLATRLCCSKWQPLNSSRLYSRDMFSRQGYL